MPYAPGISEFVERSNNAMPPDFYLRPVEEQRRLYLGLTVEFPYELPLGVAIADESVTHDGVEHRVRVYRPEHVRGRGMLVYIRGGGFVVGSLETHNSAVAELAANSGLVTIALDFPMAPEHPFPAAVEHCYRALCGLAEQAARFGADPDKIVVCGDSSGANMAVVLAMMTRDRGGPSLAGQALISPVLDFTRWRHGGDDAPLLTGGEMEYYVASYCPDPAQAADPHVSPLVSGSFHGLPPAYVMGAEMDSLLVDSEEYARRLRANGTPVELVVEPGLVHAAVRARALSPAVADAWRRFCDHAARLASAPARTRFAVVVDPYSSGTFFAPAFRAAGIPVVAVLSRPEVLDVYAASWRPDDFDQVIRYTGDLREVVDQLRVLDPYCVVPGADGGVELADALAARLTPERANVPTLTAARRDKGAMAAAVAAAGLPVLRQIATDDPAEVEAWIAREGLAGRDLVVKPPRSASTDGVVRLPGGRGWREAFGAQLGKPNQWGVVNDRMLVMEYAVGTEYVVDTFSADGVHTVTDVTRYTKVDNGPHMAVYDSMEWLAPDEPHVAELVDYTRGVLDAVGMRFGSAHVELMLTDEGPRLIELNARPHGGGQPPYCRHATGDSQVDRTVRAVTGGELPEGYELRRRLLVVFLIGREPGVVTNAGVLAGVRDLPSHHESVVHVRDGQRIEVTKDLLNTLSLGFVVLAHEDREQVMADYAAVRRLEAALVLAPPLPAAGA